MTRKAHPVAIVAALASTPLFCQNPNEVSPFDGTTPTINAPGAPDGAYQLSSIEHLNLATRHLLLSIPLVNVPGRGAASEMCARARGS